MVCSGKGGTTLLRRFTGCERIEYLKCSEFDLEAFMAHFQIRAVTASTLVGHCTLSLAALT
ncbi:hypothetical protein OIU79_003989 [Salix purpurea]|uniref:Uncharacterized protein n=1 Tax=Salix purpurea TaxID=77065 RepID=A0A9Q0U985_SALPP|nr:hypothetical protein OIU79_003989 [Salix purpurea]